VAIIGIIAWMMSANADQKTIAVVDESKEFITALVSDGSEIYNFYGSEDIQGIKDTLSDSEYLNGLLVIPELDNNFSKIENEIELTTNGNIGVAYKESLESKLTKRLEELKMQKAGISREAMEGVKSNVKIQSFNLNGNAQDGGDYLKFGLAIFLAYIIFMFIMIYGVRVMRSVVEEKQNRVVEIIISSVKPFNLMMGKILGTTFVALTQFFVWILMGTGLTLAGSSFISSKMNLPTNINSAQTEVMMAQNPEWMLKTKETFEVLLDLNYTFIISIFLIYFFI